MPVKNVFLLYFSACCFTTPGPMCKTTTLFFELSVINFTYENVHQMTLLPVKMVFDSNTLKTIEKRKVQGLENPQFKKFFVQFVFFCVQKTHQRYSWYFLFYSF